VRFLWNTRVERIETEGGAFAALRHASGSERADAAIVALGPEAPRHLAPLGLKLPIYPVKGYSLTLPIRDAAAAPRAGLMDESAKVAISRIGDRLRFAGTAELAGFDLSIPESRKATLRYVAQSWFPRAADLAQGEYWTGLRPMTPDGPPILGTTPVKGLYLNLGHGSQGWTQAWGSGKAVADLVAGAAPEIDLSPYAWSRFS
jgi:D-amino-acid dehydrogenase